jgi:hypothetical protein
MGNGLWQAGGEAGVKAMEADEWVVLPKDAAVTVR